MEFILEMKNSVWGGKPEKAVAILISIVLVCGVFISGYHHFERKVQTETTEIVSVKKAENIEKLRISNRIETVKAIETETSVKPENMEMPKMKKITKEKAESMDKPEEAVKNVTKPSEITKTEFVTKPEVPVKPETEIKQEGVVNSERAIEPEDTVKTEITTETESILKPEIAIEPEDTVESEITTDPEGVVKEEIGIEEDIIIEEEVSGLESTKVSGEIKSPFLIDEAGMIYGFLPEYADLSNGLLELPSEGCIGIRKGTFTGCSEYVAEIYIPSGITTIEDGALNELISLEWITVEAGNANYTAIDGILFSSSGTELYAYPPARVGAYSIPAGIVNIAGNAFQNTSLFIIDLRECGLGENCLLNISESCSIIR